MMLGGNGLKPKSNGKDVEFKRLFAEEHHNARIAQINLEQGINVDANRAVVEACNKHMREFGVEPAFLLAIRN